MGLRYRKQIRVTDGVKLNISKSGLSTSIGKPGATVNLSSRGTRATVGIPGTGLSYSRLTPRRRKAKVTKAEVKELRKETKRNLGFSEKEMKTFERLARANPVHMSHLSDPEIKAIVRYHRKREKRASIFLIIFIAAGLFCMALLRSK